MIPQDELKLIRSQLDRASVQPGGLDALKPIFLRLDELARTNPHDFELQVAINEVKQKVISLATEFKQAPQAPTQSTKPKSPAATPPPPPVSSPASTTPPPARVSPPEPPKAEAKPGESPRTPRIVIPPKGTKVPPKSMPTKAKADETHSTQFPLPIGQQPPAGAASSSPPGAAPLDASTVGQAGVGSPPGQAAAKSGPPAKPKPEGKKKWSQPVWVGVLAGLALSIVLILVITGFFGEEPGPRDVPVQITTLPTGATINVEGQAQCADDCLLQLPPGEYQVRAELPGYEPFVTLLNVEEGKLAALDIQLQPQAQSLRILADLNRGTVTVDGEKAGDLEQGEFTIDDLTPGEHDVLVAGGNSRAEFHFTVAEGDAPQIDGPITTRNLLAVLVSSFGSQADLVTSNGPMPLTVNGETLADATEEGVTLTNFMPGEQEIVVGEGNDQKTLTESFDAAPTLTAFLKTDQNIGTLVVATGESGVDVFVNGRRAGQTSRGQFRLQTIGPVTVRVSKEGFEEVPEQSTTVTKGSSSRLAFTMKALPEFSSLEISDGTPGAEVLIDGQVVGSILGDGVFRNSSVSPGSRTVQIRRDNFEPKSFEVDFKAGEPIVLAGGQAVLAAIPVAPPPKPEVAKAPPKAAPAPKPKPEPVRFGMEGFEQPDRWQRDGDMYTHRGEADLLFGPKPDGVFTFTIHLIRGGNFFRAGRVRWMLDFQDPDNYVFFELNDDSLWTKAMQDGDEFERSRIRHGLKDDLKEWTVRLDVSSNRVITQIRRDGQWVTLDTWNEPRDFTSGKFGILVKGDDEVGLSNFSFVGREPAE